MGILVDVLEDFAQEEDFGACHFSYLFGDQSMDASICMLESRLTCLSPSSSSTNVKIQVYNKSRIIIRKEIN